jgi:transposase
VQEVIPEGTKIEDVDIWFQDEARVGQKGTLTRTWAKKGTRPRLRRQQQFEYVYIFGAVCPARNASVGLVLPSANSEAMLVHLREIAAQVPPGRHAVVVLDGAAWHTTKNIKIFENLSLLRLPPASPELNPVEQIWQQLRDNWLANRCYDGYEAIVDACCDAWNWFVDTPNRMRQLCTRAWATL